MEALAFSPSHITGFFEIVDEPSKPVLKGSRGAGVSLSKGVKTHVKIKESLHSKLEVNLNGKVLNSTRLTRHVMNALLPQGDRRYSVIVYHEMQVPIGSGFGSSGACALSLSIAINEALGIGLSKIEAARIAHIAEVECKTGLGTVIAETYGGFEVRIRAGAPGVGEIEQVPIGNDYSVVCLNFGPISTKKVLNDVNSRIRINEAGSGLTIRLMKEPSPEYFMKLSREFADFFNIFSDRMKNILNEVDKYGFRCSMAMIGETCFSFTKTHEAEELAEIFRKHARSEKDVIFSSIDTKGARRL
ncbi:MAG: pantoate kinase [Candidatus Methylarchaceae archaeon HK02M1]|nr:pantoate kinase [Candidatus Methylarchaceae archaeon HK02M1]